ncbi:MAG: thioredoxin domain-containing protein [Campylobacterales bacterium]
MKLTNRLLNERSPYLQAHAKNPVHWQPWDEAALAAAREGRRPIFLSIGYATCHWCHVMEKEVFENPELAAILNAHFVSIKVDREERPDLDAYFQQAHSLFQRRPGGWPLSMFLTHEGKPFYAATYIPPVPRHGLPGFGDLVSLIAKRYREAEDEVKEAAGELTAALGRLAPKTAGGPLPGNLIEGFVQAAEAGFDSVDGGFGRAPKFPHHGALLLLGDLAASGHEKVAKMLDFTLDKMAQGGLYDLIDGGFCRYATDEAWHIPHFEKMTYDNALLAFVYARAGKTAVARRTLEFMNRRMKEGDLFFSASDADSEGGEGGYFVYDWAEGVAAGLDEATLRVLGFSKIGVFEGKNIARITGELPPDRLQNALEKLAQIRANRAYPFIDRKLIAAQNGMMVLALLEAGGEFTAQGLATARAIKARFWAGETLLHMAIDDHEAQGAAFLDDYAWVLAAAIAAYEHSSDSGFLEWAAALAQQTLARFFDQGRWRFSSGRFVTYAEAHDGSTPSCVGVMAQNLVRLFALSHDEKFRRFAQMTLQSHARDLADRPFDHATLLRAALKERASAYATIGG